MQCKVDKIVPSESDSSVAGSVVVDGKTLPTDLVIMGVGVAPATEFLRESREITLEKDGGVKVDEYMKVPGLNDVYAIGDIAVHPQKGGEHVRIEHWNVSFSSLDFLLFIEDAFL